ncbi:2OG-Fe(II) oxygenase [Luminiphilus syltensis NOR5-1B]|uniref:2-oxoglutarate-dependent ethylene/succinate-forming enzyme n=1 Tax=Luminiphilus syltensis NOR5-1B TaxID=565045 RepID=B8KWM3_9GAMM|nr:2OG-Fe(II) oxygenase [Luminiphilus syltensis NOR5-1B]
MRFVASLRDYGFAALIDHPLDMQRVRRIYSEWQTCFRDGGAEAYAMDPERQDGYFSTERAEHAKGFNDRDFKEYFQYYTWGRCPDGLRQDLADHFQQALDVASSLLSWVERYAPEDVVARFSESLPAMIAGSQQSMLRVLHYPPVPEGRSVLRAAPHEDINLLTLLPASDGPGLEILQRNGEWLTVPNRENQVLINIGDMLQEASGGYFPSTTHQVSPPSGDDIRKGRMSLPLFLHPRPEVVLSERYTAGSYLSERLGELGVVS